MEPLLSPHRRKPDHHGGLSKQVRVRLPLRPTCSPFGPEADLVNVVKNESAARLQKLVLLRGIRAARVQCCPVLIAFFRELDELQILCVDVASHHGLPLVTYGIPI